MMEDNEVYDELNDYDDGHKNKYEEHWGTLLNFLDESKLDEATISRLNKSEHEENNSFLQNHDLINEIVDKKPKNMSDMYEQLSNVPERTMSNIDRSGYQTQSPDMNYVYESKKKAVVMVRKKANTQMKKNAQESSFYSQQERPTNATAASGSKIDNLSMGYQALVGSPALRGPNKLNDYASRARATANRKNISGRGGAISMYKQRAKEEDTKTQMLSDKAIKENHLLRSMRKLKQQDDKSTATRIGVGGKNENFARMTSQLNNVRKRFGTRSNNHRPNTKEEKLMNQMYQKRSQPDVPGDLKSQFGGVAPSLLLASHKTENWIKKRDMQSKTEVNRKHVEFAKNLFLSWDDDGSGEIEPIEVIRPLITMGLSSDSKFVNKLLQAIETNAKKKKSDLKLTMLDFIKVFKSDKFSEQISNIISREIDTHNVSKISIQHAKSFMAPTPEPYASKIGSRNITIAMKTDNEGIVEIPVNSHLSGTISVYKRQETNKGSVKSKKTFKIDDRTETLMEENHEQRLEEGNSKSIIIMSRTY